MKITSVNPFLYQQEKNGKKDTQDVLFCLNTPNHLGDALANMLHVRKPFFFVPSPKLFWDTDFMVFERKIRETVAGNDYLFYLNNDAKLLNYYDNNEHYRIFGGLFWNDFEGLNHELVTLSLIKSAHYQKIQAHEWFDNAVNLENFYEISEHLKKNNSYNKTVKKYYKSGYFHPIISYLLYKEGVDKLIAECQQPFNGKRILLSYHQPLDYGFYFNQKDLYLQDYLDNDNFLKKVSLEVPLTQLSLDYVFHGCTQHAYSYRYYNRNIVGVNLSQQEIVLNDYTSLNLYKNTLHFLTKENLKFLDIIRNHILDNKVFFNNTTELMKFIKTYNHLFALIEDTWSNPEILDDFKNLTVANVGISEQETMSNQLGEHLQNQRVKFILHTLSQNQLALQKALNKLKGK